MRSIRLTVGLVALTLLAGCGGGGSSGSGGAAPARAAASAAPAAAPSTASSTQAAPPLPAATFEGSPPETEPLRLAVRRGESVTGRVPASDADDDIVSYAQTLPIPQFGRFEFTNPHLGHFVYHADGNASGVELIEYQVRDREGRFGLGRIEIDVLAASEVAGSCPVESTGFEGRVRDLQIHPRDEQILIARVDPDFSSGPRELWRSDDGGAVWTRLRRDVREVFLDPRDPDRVWASSRTGSPFARLLRSDDGGESFELVLELSGDARVTDLDVDARRGRVWVTTSAGLMLAEDDRTFRMVHAAPREAVRVVGAAGDVLLVSDESGVFRSRDDGAGFTQVATLDRASLTVAPSDRDRVYAWRDGTLLVSEDAGASWIDRGVPGSLLLDLEADPIRADGLVAAYDFDFAESGDAGHSFDVRRSSTLTRAVAAARDGRRYVGLDDRLDCTFAARRPSIAERDASALELDATLDALEAPVGEGRVLVADLHNRTGSVLTSLRYEVRRSGELLRSDYDHLVEAATVAVPEKLVAVGPLADLAAGATMRVELPFEARLGPGLWAYEITIHGLETAPTVARVPFVVRGTSVETSRVRVESADLDYRTPLLNAVTPFAVISTPVGETRRVVLDVRNRGPAAARDVVVDVFDANGAIGLEVGTPSQGRCTRYVDRVRCEFGTIEVNFVAGVDVSVTLSAAVEGLRALPTELTTTSPSTSAFPVPELLADLAVRIEAIGATGAGGVRHGVRITNAGPAASRNTRLVGEVGPWPAVTQADLGPLPAGCSSPLDECVGADCAVLERAPATYQCDVAPDASLQIAPGEEPVVPIDILAAAEGRILHAVRVVTSRAEGGVADNLAALAAPR